MAFGKFRNGITSIGRQASNWLQDGQPTFATRRRGDVLVRKSGDFTNIFQQQGEDGFYSLGRVSGKGTRIVGSPDARGFSDRGPAPAAGGFITSQLGFYGRGRGSVLTSASVGNFLDFDGRPCSVFTYTLARTRTGRRLVDYYGVDSFVPFGAPESLASLTRGGYWKNGTRDEFYAGMAVPCLLDGGQHVQAYVVDDGASQSFGQTIYYPNQLGWFSDSLHLAPGVLLKMDRYLRPHYTPTSVNAAACPGLSFSYSVDAGRTWAPCSSTNLFDAELDSLRALPINNTAAVLFNSGVSAAEVNAAPLSRRHSVVVARVPYINSAGAMKVKVKLGLIDIAAGCSMFETQLLFEGNPEDAGIFAGRAPLAVPGGVLVFTRNVPTENSGRDAWKFPARVRFTPDGTNLVDRAPMPFQESYTGIVCGLDTKVIVCPMWDGKHSLYQSRDYGQTWSRRAVIASGGVPPNDAPAPGQEQFSLADFTVLTFLREGDRAANAFPLTPWYTDSRVRDPLPT